LNAEIIAIGSELLLGQITNTNAQFLSKELAGIGINVYYHTVVGDNSDRLREVIHNAKQRSNLIIFTGGLGPTKDDLTKETIAAAVGRSLIIDNDALLNIEAYFKRRNRVMSKNNCKQALVIEGSHVLANEQGMAPGMAFNEDGIYYLLLPGPPKEMKPMFMTYGLPFLFSKLDKTAQITSRVLNFYGIGESQLETELLDLIEAQSNPTIAPLAKDGEVTIRLTVKHESRSEGLNLLDQLEKRILERVGTFFYGYDESTLSREVARILNEEKLTLAAAESITGGLFSSELTINPGTSAIFKGGIICYSNEAKQALLHVPNAIIEKFGAVSGECAKYLAENVKELLNAQVGISFTGVAGPTQIEDKEIGTVYIAISKAGEETCIYPLNLAGTREQIQARSVKYGLYYLLKQFS
jgi:nicotinamide-nucleotide amidase